VGSQHPELFNQSRALDRERSARGRQEDRRRQCVSLLALFAVAFDDRAGSAGGCEGGFMSEHERKQREYAAKRATVTRPVRQIGGATMDNPPKITYRADQEAETRARMAVAGFEFADEAPVKGNFM
jgi:hypothetical protein